MPFLRPQFDERAADAKLFQVTRGDIGENGVNDCEILVKGFI